MLELHRFMAARAAGALAVLLGSLGTGPLAGDDATNRFGFTGPEIFPIDNQISHLRAADFDGDGRLDLVVVNNARSKITLLYNRTGQTNAPAGPRAKQELNELPPDARFRLESIASEKRISALVVADLNGDRRPDLAYFGEPKELIVQLNQGTNDWSAPKRWQLDDGLVDMNALASGDLNGDGLEDLLLLGEKALYLLPQKADHTLAEPEKIPYAGSVKAVQILDIDGDGRLDLLLVNWDHAYPFRFRLQNDAGRLGPELHFTFPPIRSYWADDLDGDRRTEIITIALKSGRAQISNFIRQPADALSGSFRQGQLQLLALSKTDKSRRGVLWADLNRDRLPDLLVAEPDSGQLTVFLQQPEGALAAARTFPTFTGVGEIAVSDWDGDGRPEVFLLSSDERQVGVTRYDDSGRVPFPTILPLEGRPLTMAVGRLAPDAPPTLAVIVDQDGRKELVLRRATGQPTRQKLSENFKSNPASLTLHDVDQDGLPDLIVLIPYEKVKVLRQQPDGPFAEDDVAAPGGSAEQPWLSTADVDGDGKAELLLGQKNFVRALVLEGEPTAPGATDKAGWALHVREQINGASSSSRIVGAAAVRNGTNQVASLFLLDADRKGVTLCERDAAGVWQVVKTVPLPQTDFLALQAVALGAPEPNSVALLGINTVGWLPLRGQTWDLKELDGYETPIKDGFLHDVVSGDLNNDGRKDLVFLETAKNHLDLVTFEPPHRLVPANRWQVFEERTFRSRRTETAEPREALVGDFTGDGKNDLAIVVHDRLLLYPQD